MDDIQREKDRGFDFEYLGDVPQKKMEIGAAYQTPGFGLAAQLFCCSARRVIERIGKDEGAAIMRQAVEDFGLERGRHIAARVKGLGASPILQELAHLLRHRFVGQFRGLARH